MDKTSDTICQCIAMLFDQFNVSSVRTDLKVRRNETVITCCVLGIWTKTVFSSCVVMRTGNGCSRKKMDYMENSKPYVRSELQEITDFLRHVQSELCTKWTETKWTQSLPVRSLYTIRALQLKWHVAVQFCSNQIICFLSSSEINTCWQYISEPVSQTARLRTRNTNSCPWT